MRQNSPKKMTRLFSATILLLSLFTFAAFAQAPAPASAKTALDKYVEAPDPSYKYESVSKVQGKGYTTYILKMTSQTWRSTAEIDRNVWWHWMIMVKPDEVKSSKALLYISGNNNNSAAPKDADQQIIQIATATKSVVTELRMIPNQPLTFSDDKKPRVEDEFIAYTWDKFLKTGD
jgi:PhoPQ-activated pathogenicity-related protein